MSTLEHLEHATVAIEGGGEVIVLDTGSVIDAEASAMLQALHSRSVGGLKAHLEVLNEKGADNFMANFYVGYGHASIGDCGTTVLFIEGVSMLAAKAIQDWRLYSGQEASTRYIDFAVQPFINPVGTTEAEAVIENWRTFYIESMPDLVASLKVRYPMQVGEKERIYNKAIDARAFDILRGFLPAGASTNLAWSTNLRQAADKVRQLRHHPLQEVQRIAVAIEAALQQAHPNSFGHKRYEATEQYIAQSMDSYYYHNPDSPDFTLSSNNLNAELLSKNRSLLEQRPAHTELPMWLEDTGELQFEFLLDFGSFRDVHRHRAVVQRMPLLTAELGFEPWYLQELPEAVRNNAEALLHTQLQKIEALKLPLEVQQYYLPMGYRCSNRLTGNLRALLYLVELRATRFVHQTLRVRAQQMAAEIAAVTKQFGVAIHLDTEPDRFDIKRGEQDIQIK